MAKSKSISKSSGSFAKGGSRHMFGQQHAGPSKSAVTGGEKAGSGGKWAKGGSGKMFGKQSAGTRTPGRSGK